MASISAYGASNQAIANRLGISRQAVTRHRRKGMPCTSIEDATAWYQTHVDYSRRRGTFSILPRRLPAFVPELEDKPEPMRLDYFEEGFWGESAVASILSILGDGSTKAFRKRENTIAAFFCIFAAMRLHLRLMPELMAKRLAKMRDADDIEAELMEWSCRFAQHWFGPDFEREPILPRHVKRLNEFYRALEGK